MTQPERFCPSCATVVAFEEPPCPDGLEECPDQACTMCGTALFTGVVHLGRRSRRRSAPTIHHAA